MLGVLDNIHRKDAAQAAFIHEEKVAVNAGIHMYCAKVLCMLTYTHNLCIFHFTHAVHDVSHSDKEHQIKQANARHVRFHEMQDMLSMWKYTQ